MPLELYFSIEIYFSNLLWLFSYCDNLVMHLNIIALNINYLGALFSLWNSTRSKIYASRIDLKNVLNLFDF